VAGSSSPASRALRVDDEGAGAGAAGWSRGSGVVSRASALEDAPVVSIGEGPEEFRAGGGRRAAATGMARLRSAHHLFDGQCSDGVIANATKQVHLVLSYAGLG